jgi:hypothetical protein
MRFNEQRTHFVGFALGEKRSDALPARSHVQFQPTTQEVTHLRVLHPGKVEMGLGPFERIFMQER